MKQNLCVRIFVEVPGFAPIDEIRDETSASGHMLTKSSVFASEENEPADRKHGDQYGEQRRKNAPNAAGIKIENAKRMIFQLSKNYCADQIARDNKEYINACVTTRHQVR